MITFWAIFGWLNFALTIAVLVGWRWTINHWRESIDDYQRMSKSWRDAETRAVELGVLGMNASQQLQRGDDPEEVDVFLLQGLRRISMQAILQLEESKPGGEGE